MNTIVIANKKGGVGKTTTAQNLASAFARGGKTILALDMDAQANLSRAWGVTAPEKSVLDVLRGKASWKASLPVEKHENGCVLLVPAVRELVALPELFAQELCKEFLLKEALSSLTQTVDVVIIDSPPALDLLAVNCYVAADRLLVPAQCEFFSLEGLKLMRDDMRRVQARLNPGLDMLGVVASLVDRLKRLWRDVLVWLGWLVDGW